MIALHRLLLSHRHVPQGTFVFDPVEKPPQTVREGVVVQEVCGRASAGDLPPPPPPDGHHPPRR